MRTANKVIYGLFGALSLLYSVAALISPVTVGGESARDVHLAHLMREQGAAGIFIGLMALWCIVNYERRRAVHYVLMVFAFLLAAIHWYDYLTGNIGWLSPIYNSVPFTVLLMMAVLSRDAANRSPAWSKASYLRRLD